eukprot:scaffold5311_cov120-Isochrysis_galbana.AAC.14
MYSYAITDCRARATHGSSQHPLRTQSAAHSISIPLRLCICIYIDRPSSLGFGARTRYVDVCCGCAASASHTPSARHELHAPKFATSSTPASSQPL